jgi:hypothetical protein
MSPELNGTALPADEEAILLDDLSAMIEAARARVAATVSSELLMLYWSVGKRIREHVLGGERAAYGEDVVKRVAAQLATSYGRGFSWQNVFRMMKFAELYPDPQIFSPLARKLTWTNMVEVLALEGDAPRDFYLVMAAERAPEACSGALRRARPRAQACA